MSQEFAKYNCQYTARLYISQIVIREIEILLRNSNI